MLRYILAITCYVSLTLALTRNNVFVPTRHKIILSKYSSWISEPLGFNTHYIDDNTTVLPEAFDAREQWPNCSTIGQVWDQGVCNAGWAISAASVLSDRICIQLNQTINPVLSPEDLLSCCTKCRFDCDGGWPNFAWEYLNEFGITTGGAYGSNIGCKSYSYPPCGHFNESSQDTLCNKTQSTSINICNKTCDATNQVNYTDNLYYAQVPYRVYPLERQIKLEIMQNGPVQATFDIWEDFLTYKNGVYLANETSEMNFIGEQSGKLVGWGTDGNNQSYWLAVNSWDTEWGEDGLFKWPINDTEYTMESQVYAAVPYFPS